MNQTNNSIFSKVFWITLLFKQNEYHKYGVLLHTFKVLYSVLKAGDYKFISSALFHDIGKPVVAYQKPEDIPVNEYSFTDHEEKSYQIIKNWPFLSDWTKNIVRYHYILRDIGKCKEEGNFKRFERLEKSLSTLDDKFISQLKVFLKYDDFGKS
ncbi:MAG: HD domain-containing protein [Arcobacteraceae bacterium]|nr:HD domain-containing protein [Arcobacteraceae bacterium]